MSVVKFNIFASHLSYEDYLKVNEHNFDPIGIRACLTTEPAFTSQDAFVQFRVGTLWANADYATVNACLTGILLQC